MRSRELSFSNEVSGVSNMGEGIKPGTNTQKPEPKSGTKFYQPNMGIKHACIKVKFMSKVDYRLFL